MDPSEPGRKSIDATARNWNYLMDCIPRYFDGQTRAIEIAERHGQSFKNVYNYLKDFEEKGLIEMSPAPAGSPPPRKIPPL